MPYAYLGFFVEGVGTSHSLKPGGNLLLIRLPAPLFILGGSNVP